MCIFALKKTINTYHHAPAGAHLDAIVDVPFAALNGSAVLARLYYSRHS